MGLWSTNTKINHYLCFIVQQYQILSPLVAQFLHLLGRLLVSFMISKLSLFLSYQQAESLPGMSELLFKVIFVSFGRASNSHGTVPVSLLSCKLSCRSSVNFPSSVGIVPEKWLFCRFNTWSCLIDPMTEGIEPAMFILTVLNIYQPWKAHK